MWSPVFKTMFFGEFRERNEDRILLPGKLVKDIEEMLQCIYPCQKSVCGKLLFYHQSAKAFQHVRD